MWRCGIYGMKNALKEYIQFERINIYIYNKAFVCSVYLPVLKIDNILYFINQTTCKN